MTQNIKTIFINKNPCLTHYFSLYSIMQTHIEVFQYVHAQHIGYKFASPIWILQVALHNEGITGESS